MNFCNESKMYNSWAHITMDFLIHEENREEVFSILDKFFSFDEEEARAFRPEGLKRLIELKETDIIDSIKQCYYLHAGGRD